MTHYPGEAVVYYGSHPHMHGLIGRIDYASEDDHLYDVVLLEKPQPDKWETVTLRVSGDEIVELSIPKKPHPTYTDGYYTLQDHPTWLYRLLNGVWEYYEGDRDSWDIVTRNDFPNRDKLVKMS